MKNLGFELNPLLKGMAVATLSLAVLSGCNGRSESDSDEMSFGGESLSDGFTFAMIDASTPSYVAYNTETDELEDLNEHAQEPDADSSEQNLLVSDTSKIGHFLIWPDFFEKPDGTEYQETKYILLNNDYAYMSGEDITHEHIEQLVHFHTDDDGEAHLAAHSGSEFDPAEYGDAWEGSSNQAGLIRLNQYVVEMADLETELQEVLDTNGKTLCRAYVDPYVKFELAHEEDSEGTATAQNETEHDHETLLHIALTDDGSVHFYAEHDGEGLDASQTPVALTGISRIDNCARTTIARVSEESLLVFIPESNRLYLVDSHDGAAFHVHSSWDMADEAEGFSVDLMAILGGEEGDHDH